MKILRVMDYYSYLPHALRQGGRRAGYIIALAHTLVIKKNPTKGSVLCVCMSHIPGPGIQEGLVDLGLNLTHSINEGSDLVGLCLEGGKKAAGYQTPLLQGALSFCLSLSQI